MRLDPQRRGPILGRIDIQSETTVGEREAPIRPDAARAAAPFDSTPELPLWLTFWLPVLAVISIPLARLVAPEFHQRWYNTKEGPIEWLTVIVLLVAVIAGVKALQKRSLLPDVFSVRWLALLTLGAFYFGGEEISWGQTLFKWGSPDLFMEFNRQEETNLHNTSSLFNEKPRLLFEMWILFGGLLRPYWRRRKQARPLTERDVWFWPTSALFTTAVVAILTRLPDRLERIVGKFEGDVFGSLRLSEPQELFFAYFLMLFLLSMNARLNKLSAARASTELG